MTREELEVRALEGPGVKLEVSERVDSRVEVHWRRHLVAVEDLCGREHHEEYVVVRPVRERGGRRVAGKGCTRDFERPDADRWEEKRVI